MDKFLEQYADITALALTFLLPAIFTISIKLKTRRETRAIPVYFLFFGPLGILVFIFFHLFENSYRAIIAAMNGSFVYDFHFYSLILMGLVIAAMGYTFLNSCLHKCFDKDHNSRTIFYCIVLILIVCGAQIPLAQISVVPLICCGITTAALFFVRRKTKEIYVTL
jgi:hypothetical protein